MNITGHDLIMACSAIGAGLAVIAGIGPGIRQGRCRKAIPESVECIGEQKRFENYFYASELRYRRKGYYSHDP